MSLLRQLNKAIPSLSLTRTPTFTSSGPTAMQPLNQGLTVYPYSRDNTFINEGYNKNAFVYAIVNKCAKKFSQINWYHYRIKKTARKDWEEYVLLTKDGLNEKAAIEARKLRKSFLTKSADQVIVDDDVSRLLAKPNRNQSGALFREQLYGYKLLTGEGNLWLSRPTDGDGAPDMSKPPDELFIIPKDNLALVKGGDPWTIEAYKLLLGAQQFLNDASNVIMWKFPNYVFDPITLSHLRGQAPLDSGLLLMQASNEAQERLATMNKNQGVAGMVYNKGQQQAPTVEQAIFMRRQFNSIINDRDLAGTIAYMTGDLGFMQFGLSVEQLQLLEQANVTNDGLCNIFDVPPGIFTKDQTYENRKEQKKELIYDNIAPAAYGLRDELNAKLIPQFGLDTDRDVIDCDILGSPDLVEDLKTQVNTIARVWQLSPNEMLEYLGFDRKEDENMDKVYVPNNLIPLDQLNSDIGAAMDAQVNLLNANNGQQQDNKQP